MILDEVVKIVQDSEKCLDIDRLPYTPTDEYLTLRETRSLGRLIQPTPRFAAKNLANSILTHDQPVVGVVFSESMCTGKTEVCISAADFLDPKREGKVLCYQPEAGIRFGDTQREYIISRRGLCIPSKVIGDNSLVSILEDVQANDISPQDKPYIIIDEGMLFIAQAGKNEEAIEVLNTLRNMGFSVIINGLAYSFNKLPFTFMHALVQQSLGDENWLQMQLTTKCVFCDLTACGSMRLIDPGKDQHYRVADFHNGQYLAGDNYVPVCCVNHDSCSNTPDGFIRSQIFN